MLCRPARYMFQSHFHEPSNARIASNTFFRPAHALRPTHGALVRDQLKFRAPVRGVRTSLGIFFSFTFTHFELIHMHYLVFGPPLVTMDLIRYVVDAFHYLSSIAIAPEPFGTSPRIVSQIQDVNIITRFESFHMNLFIVPVFHSGGSSF